MTSFKEVPVGTKCFVKTFHGWYITHVTRHTKTQVITTTSKNEEKRWSITNGHEVGGDKWRSVHLEVFTDKHQIIVDKFQLKCKLRKALKVLELNIDNLTEDDLNILLSIDTTQ
ncbi:hypothetical protein S140_141 [Shewanella sp. phage 1/40]|uniref:hypothetical protein n=1 Tax=Shewanella sp. phage 1/40 TaxID=1458860 RepID=UPI0004F84F02|nr:hypothetical protein S140_141 [Shewanella sp. phage 1/40]AHK11548.1 hypothetical protein S140_141 [Shewanella sp. phage 1/40]